MFASGSDCAEKHVDFVSIGTNDLTQLVFGFSRDDTQRFMPTYLEQHIMAKDPFVSLDVRGVGSLVTYAVNKCRKANPAIKVGVCGEHGGDPASIQFFNKAGLDYISCSPARVPIAKIAAAQAHIEDITLFATTCVVPSFPYFLVSNPGTRSKYAFSFFDENENISLES